MKKIFFAFLLILPFTNKGLTKNLTPNIIYSEQTLYAEGYNAEWMISAQSTLKSGLTSWASLQACNIDGIPFWSVKWLTDVNYPIDQALHFRGTFRQALTSALILYANAPKPLYAKIYSSQCLVIINSSTGQ